MAKAGPAITVHVLDLPEVRALVAELNATYERLHTAATRVCQLVTHNSSDLEVGAAIAELRKVLDEQGGGRC